MRNALLSPTQQSFPVRPSTTNTSDSHDTLRAPHHLHHHTLPNRSSLTASGPSVSPPPRGLHHGDHPQENQGSNVFYLQRLSPRRRGQQLSDLGDAHHSPTPITVESLDRRIEDLCAERDRLLQTE
eukprot:PhF_6_TR42943/c0_g1_i6/m.65257